MSIPQSCIVWYSSAKAPKYATAGAAGADLLAELTEPIVIEPMERKLIPTGLKIALMPYYEAQVRPRSGLALKHGVTVLNAPGTIDSDYRGEIGVILINLGSEKFTVTDGMAIAQLVIAPVMQGYFHLSEKLSETARGEGGFGSTDQKK